MLSNVLTSTEGRGAAQGKATIRTRLNGFKTRVQIGCFLSRIFAIFWDLILIIFAQYCSSERTNLPSPFVARFYLFLDLRDFNSSWINWPRGEFAPKVLIARSKSAMAFSSSSWSKKDRPR